MNVTFTDASTGDPTSWSWTFGDGSTSTQQNPTHQYTAAGTYTVALTATNANGSDTETKTDYITVTDSPQPPVAEFTSDVTSGDVPLAVQFTDQSTGAPASWSWDFGDGGTSTQQNPSHTYNSAGTYTVSLTVTNAQGSDTETKNNMITVNDPGLPDPPVAAFGSNPSEGYVPLTHMMTVQFTDQSTNTPTSWAWDFGDGSTSSEQNPSHTYTSAGDFTVQLIAANAGGSDTVTGTVSLHLTPADFFAAPAMLNMNGKASLVFGIPLETRVSVQLYNVNGQLVKTLADTYYAVGEHAVDWDLTDEKGQSVSPGAYFMLVKADQGHASAKIIVTH